MNTPVNGFPKRPPSMRGRFSCKAHRRLGTEPLMIIIIGLIIGFVIYVEPFEEIEGTFNVQYNVTEPSWYKFKANRCIFKLLLNPERQISFSTAAEVDVYFWDYFKPEERVIEVVGIKFDNSIKTLNNSKITLMLTCQSGIFNMNPSTLSFYVQPRSHSFFTKKESVTSTISVQTSFDFKDSINENKLIVGVAGRLIDFPKVDIPAKIYGPSVLKYDLKYTTRETLSFHMPKIVPTIDPYFFTLKKNSQFQKDLIGAGYDVIYSFSFEATGSPNFENTTLEYHFQGVTNPVNSQNEYINIVPDTYICICLRKQNSLSLLSSDIQLYPEPKILTCKVDTQCRQVSILARLKESPYPKFIFAHSGQYVSPPVASQITYLITIPSESTLSISEMTVSEGLFSNAKITLGDVENNHYIVKQSTKQASLKYRNNDSSPLTISLIITPETLGFPTSVKFNISFQVTSWLPSIIVGAVAACLLCSFILVSIGMVTFVIKRNKSNQIDDHFEM